ncbi:MAG: hypothetical protein SYR96_35255, partial [Actinomycetota bacterium]|nr:hypothetical protein [Actinomycetota bacterium]
MSDPTEKFGGGAPQPRHRRRPRRVAVVILAGVAVLAVAGSAVAVSLVGGSEKDTPVPTLAGASAAGPSAASPDVPSPGAGPSGKVTTVPAPEATPVKPVEAPRAGWVPVDRAAWQKQVATYKARKVDPVPAGVGDLPEFRADCEFSHRRADDPIVFPGLPG